MNNNMVIANQKLVHHICHKHFYKYLHLHEYEDLVATGMLALVKAARRYKPETGNAFSTYAYSFVRGEILRYVLESNAGGIKVSRTKKLNGVSVPCYSIQSLVDSANNDDRTFEGVLGVEQDFTGANIAELFSGVLSEREKLVCIYKAAGFTQVEIAKAIGVTQTTISRNLSDIKKKLKKFLEEGGKER